MIAAKQDRRVLQKTALAEIIQQRGGRLISGSGVLDAVAMQIVVLIPTRKTDLDETNSGFG